HFDARRVAVVPHPEIAESERTQRGFGALDLIEILARDLGAVGNPRSETGRGRLVGARKSVVRGRGTHVGLAESELGERRTHLVFGGGETPGAMIGKIVGNRAVEDRARTAAQFQLVQLAIQLVLAVVAAIARIASEARIGKLAGAHDLDSRAERARLV